MSETALNAANDGHTSEWRGAKKQPIYNKNCSMGQVIYNSLNNWPKNICQISDTDGKALTNSEALACAIRIALHFKAKGLTCNDVVGIIARNSTYVMPVSVACLFNTTPFHAVNASWDAKTVAGIFGITKPKLIFCDGQYYEKIFTATRDWQPDIITLTDHIEGVTKLEELLDPEPKECNYRPERLVSGGEQTMAILCSSGTTGLPKAVCLSNESLQRDNLFCISETVIYSSSGLDWGTGLWTTLMSAMIGCTRIISENPYSSEHFVELVQKYRIACAILAPWHILSLLACRTATSQALSSLYGVCCGGGWVSPQTLQQARHLITNAIMFFAYGTTETGVVAMNMNSELGNSVGRVLPGYRVRIVNENGKSLNANEVGEILVHNGQKWNGYYGNSIETQRLQDADGWFHTGDLGFFDDNNNLYIVDRKRETLKYKAMQYWPKEIEQVIAELPEVQNVCVVGIFNEQYGDEAGALIVRKKDSQISEQAIKDYVAKQLIVDYKQLHAGVQFIETLPISPNGKVLRQLAKELFENNLKLK